MYLSWHTTLPVEVSRKINQGYSQDQSSILLVQGMLSALVACLYIHKPLAYFHSMDIPTQSLCIVSQTPTHLNKHMPPLLAVDASKEV